MVLEKTLCSPDPRSKQRGEIEEQKIGWEHAEGTSPRILIFNSLHPLVSAIANQTKFDIIKQTLYDCLGEQSKDVDIFLHYSGRIVIGQLADEEELGDCVLKCNLLFPNHRLRLETVAEGPCEIRGLYSHDYDEIYSEEGPRHFERLGVDVEFYRPYSPSDPRFWRPGMFSVRGF